MDIKNLIQNLDKSNVTIGVLGSHSALDVCRGAKDLGFKTLVVTEKGRGKTYSEYYRSHKGPSTTSIPLSTGSLRTNPEITEFGCVDEVLELNKFADLLNENIQKTLQEKSVIFVPHRSFEVYINSYSAIETKFMVPIFGNRFLLKVEERGMKPNQYDLLAKAQIKFPKQYNSPEEIDRLVIVKVLERDRGFERAFFLTNSYEDFKTKTEIEIASGKYTKEALENAVIEEFVIGVQVNFNFFYDPIESRLELIGTDNRRQTNIEGYSKIPLIVEVLNYHQKIAEHHGLKYEEAGHIAVTVLESLLEQAFELGEKFIKAAREMFPPGVIGPFGLQTMIIPGPPKKEIIVFDVSPRMPGSPGIFATPYSGYLFGENISMGKRVAMQIKTALESDKLDLILT